MDKFLEFKEKGITILYVSHDVNSIKRFCDRAIWLNEGKIQLDGNVDYVTDQYLDYLKMLDNKVAEEKSHHIQVVKMHFIYCQRYFSGKPCFGNCNFKNR